MEYYEILGILRSSSDQEIRRAYRQLALKHHPDRNPTSKEESAKLFQQISEAYDVLSDPKKRAIYDRFGYEGLHGELPQESEGEPWEGYQYKQNSQQIFAEFFGTSNPFAVFGADGATPFASRLAAREPKKLPPVMHNLECTLEELYNGGVRRMKITRSRSGIPETKQISIQIKAGWRAGVKITFPNEGDDGVNVIPSDIIFVIHEMPHSNYCVIDNELTYTATISLMDALSTSSLVIPTLDGRQIALSVDEVVNPNTVLHVPHEGLMARDMKTRGNLAVKFNILFPMHLTQEKRRSLRELLSNEAVA